MEINIIKGIHKRIACVQVIISLLFIPISIIWCVQERSLLSVFVLIGVVLTIIVFTILLEVACLHDEPHKMFIDNFSNKVTLVYKNKQIDIENVIEIRPVNDKRWFVAMFFDFGFYHNIVIKYEEDNVVKEKHIGYAPKYELRRIIK